MNVHKVDKPENCLGTFPSALFFIVGLYIQIMDFFVPVSYTHLDVYKRQV